MHFGLDGVKDVGRKEVENLDMMKLVKISKPRNKERLWTTNYDPEYDCNSNLNSISSSQ